MIDVELSYKVMIDAESDDDRSSVSLPWYWYYKYIPFGT